MTDMETIYQATLDTRNFSFEAYGKTDQEAILAMRHALERHARQYRISADASFEEYVDSIEVRPIVLGLAYRDGEPL